MISASYMNVHPALARCSVNVGRAQRPATQRHAAKGLLHNGLWRREQRSGRARDGKKRRPKKTASDLEAAL